MKIKIENTDKSRAKLQKALDTAQGRCTARIVDVDHIFRVCNKLLWHLDEYHIPKKYRKNCRIKYHEVVACNAYTDYSWSASTTVIEITRCSSGYFLTACERDRIPAGNTYDREYFFFPSNSACDWLRDNIVDRFERSI